MASYLLVQYPCHRLGTLLAYAISIPLFWHCSCICKDHAIVLVHFLLVQISCHVWPVILRCLITIFYHLCILFVHIVNCAYCPLSILSIVHINQVLIALYRPVAWPLTETMTISIDSSIGRVNHRYSPFPNMI